MAYDLTSAQNALVIETTTAGALPASEFSAASDNDAVASIGGIGTGFGVFAHGAGSANITVTRLSDSQMVTHAVTVTAEPFDWTLATPSG